MSKTNATLAAMHDALFAKFGDESTIVENLDELVHGIADEHASGQSNQVGEDHAVEIDEQFSDKASTINNEGVDSQLAYLLRECGEQGAWSLLAENCGIAR